MALVRRGTCSMCGACCKGFTLTTDKEFSRDLVKYYANYGVTITRKGNKTIFRFDIVCRHLDLKTNKCKIYGKGRPIICMQYPREEDADNLPKECTYRFEKE